MGTETTMTVTTWVETTMAEVMMAKATWAKATRAKATKMVTTRMRTEVTTTKMKTPMKKMKPSTKSCLRWKRMQRGRMGLIVTRMMTRKMGREQETLIRKHFLKKTPTGRQRRAKMGKKMKKWSTKVKIRMTREACLNLKRRARMRKMKKEGME